MPATEPSAADGPVADPSPAEAQSDLSFPRAARLLERRAYDAVFRDNRRFADRYWSVLVHRRDADPEGPARLGLAIAKKRARRAVERNRLKRLVRESFRLHRAALAGRDLVVMNRDDAVAADAATLRRSLGSLWTRAARGEGRRSRPPDARRGDGERRR